MKQLASFQKPLHRETLYVRGKISPPDHATIRLDDWHRVAMNTESQSSSVAFLD